MTGRIKKILVVNKYHFVSGGAERYFLNIMETLRKKEIECIPLSVNYSKTLPTPYQKYFIPPVACADEAKIVNQKLTFGQKVEIAKRAIYNTHVRDSVRRIYEDHRPDIAYLLNFNNHISPSVIDACHEFGIPVVMRMSDFNLTCPSNMYFRDGHPCTDCKGGLHHALIHRCVHGSLVRTATTVVAMAGHRLSQVYRKVGAFVCPTQFMKNELIQLGFHENIVHQINTFAKLEENKAPDLNSPYILYIGRFAQYKGIDTAIRAFSKVKNKKGITFRLMGDEGDRDAARVKSLASSIGCENIQFLPFEREKKKIIEAIQGSLFTVLPFENYENLPNVILESFSCARPVISTRLGSTPDVLKEGEYGLLYEYGHMDEFTQKLEWLIENKEARERMGAAAYQAIKEDYSEEKHVQKLISLFESLLPPAQPIPNSPTLVSAFR